MRNALRALDFFIFCFLQFLNCLRSMSFATIR